MKPIQFAKFRTIRSFVCRNRPLRPTQRKTFNELWQRFGVEINQGVDMEELFCRQAEKHLEIGFGMGETLIDMARKNPQNDYIGIDVYLQGICRVLKQVDSENLNNLRLFYADAFDVLENCVMPNSLDAVYLFFPDPWPKKRHHKRRLVQNEFVNLIAQRLKLGGCFYLATDWGNYAEQMLDVLDSGSTFVNTAGVGHFASRPDLRPLTKFERRGRNLGHEVWDLIYVRKQDTT